MGMESPKFEGIQQQAQAPAQENHEKEKSLEVSSENVLEGRGFEEIERIGWQKYRAALVNLSYGDIVEKQVSQIKQLEAQQEYKTGKTPEWITHEQNVEARGRARNLSSEFSEKYSKEKLLTYYSYQDRGKKVFVNGKNIEVDDKNNPIGRPVTRFYFSVPTKSSPEAFKSLFTSLVDEGVMGKIQLALNLENYQGESLDKSFENNNLVLYAYGENPQLMEKITKAITRAKRSSPDAWQLSATNTAKAKEEMVKDFMIPLDDTTAFVEMDNLRSYHADVRGHVYYELLGEMPHMKKTSIDEFAKKVKERTANTRGVLSEFPKRKRNMPALVTK